MGGNPVWPVGLLIIGSNGIIAILLPLCLGELSDQDSWTRHPPGRDVYEGRGRCWRKL